MKIYLPTACLISAIVTGCMGTFPKSPIEQKKESRVAVPLGSVEMQRQRNMLVSQGGKIAFACCYFRNAYDRWPKDVAELQGRVDGTETGGVRIISITPQTNDSVHLAIQTANSASITVVPFINLHLTDAQKTAAQEPGFKVRL